MNSKNYHQKKRFGQHWLVNKKILEKIKHLDKSEYVLRPDFINTLRLFN